MSIQTQISRIEGAKTAIASAISAKGVSVPADTKIDEMAALIESIPSGDNSEPIELDVVNNTVSYTLQSPMEKVLLYPYWTESLETADSIYIYINDVEYECFHSDLRVHTLPEDLYTYEHWSAGGGGTTDEDEIKELWKAGAVIRAERVTAASVHMQKGYDEGLEEGYANGYNQAEIESPFYYIKDMSFRFTGRTFSSERSNVVCRVLDCQEWSMGFGQLSGIKTLKIICDTEGLTVNWAQLVRQSTDLELLDLTEFACYPSNISYFGLDSKKLKTILGAFDLTACTNTTLAFTYTDNIEDIEFVPNTIKISIGFDVCRKLTKASIESIIAGLADDVSDQTVTLTKTAVNNAFATSEGAADGSTSAEWAALIATKPNWTVSISVN